MDFEGYPVIFNDCRSIAKSHIIKKYIEVNKKVKRILKEEKKLNSILFHEVFHIRYNIPLSIILIIAELVILYLIFGEKYYVFLMIIASVFPIGWFLEFSADIYSAYKNGKKNLFNAFDRLKIRGDLFHPSRSLRKFVVSLLFRK